MNVRAYIVYRTKWYFAMTKLFFFLSTAKLQMTTTRGYDNSSQDLCPDELKSSNKIIKETIFVPHSFPSYCSDFCFFLTSREKFLKTDEQWPGPTGPSPVPGRVVSPANHSIHVDIRLQGQNSKHFLHHKNSKMLLLFSKLAPSKSKMQVTKTHQLPRFQNARNFMGNKEMRGWCNKGFRSVGPLQLYLQ